MRQSVFALSVAAFALAVAAKAGEDAKGGPEGIRGVYTIVRGETEGKEVPKEHIEGSKVVITEKSIVGTDKSGKRVYVADYTLDRSKSPYRLKMKIAEGPEKGMTATGLIAREGKRVKLVYALPGGEAPTDFSTKAKGRQNYFILEPVKASPKESEKRDR